jgi:uncharacterized protein (UPF0276 family)
MITLGTLLMQPCNTPTGLSLWKYLSTKTVWLDKRRINSVELQGGDKDRVSNYDIDTHSRNKFREASEMGNGLAMVRS